MLHQWFILKKFLKIWVIIIMGKQKNIYLKVTYTGDKTFNQEDALKNVVVTIKNVMNILLLMQIHFRTRFLSQYK